MPRTKMWYIFYTFIVFGLFSGVGLYLALYLNDGAILTRPATGVPIAALLNERRLAAA